jgi:NADH:ubiquinone oxidoreductase subunit E/Pyruvate/2-oxoacid:ferredoxin oxidoreductase delta subunit
LGDITLTIDGKKVLDSPGTTIMAAAERAGIEIPSLCHKRELSPIGSCRICVVEVEGVARLVGSCHTPISENMVVRTNTARVKRARQAVVDLLLAGHTGPCVTDSGAADCELHQLAAAVEAGPPAFNVRKARFYLTEDQNPYVKRNLSRCILCHRCIRTCAELAKKSLYSMAYRGSEAKVVFGFDEPLNTEICKNCGLCIELCPTTALSAGPGLGKAKKLEEFNECLPPAAADEKRATLLPLLKAQQAQKGFVSKTFMIKTAEALGLTLGEVYGVATFYAFVSEKPRGRHIIRICKDVPCFIKNGLGIIDGVQAAIGIAPGETTADGRFSFMLASCIGACDKAPAMLVDDDVHGNLTPEKIDKILRKYD